MPQKTNLNISPYYDDFDKEDKFYKVLFKPGFPVQARELTTLQSQLQNQIESFGSHIFKDGSMVIPGAISYDSNYYSIRIKDEHLGIPVSLYLDQLIGKTLKGQTTGITLKIDSYLLAGTSSEINDLTFPSTKDCRVDDVFKFTADNLFANEPMVVRGKIINVDAWPKVCLLYTSDAAADLL